MLKWTPENTDFPLTIAMNELTSEAKQKCDIFKVATPTGTVPVPDVYVPGMPHSCSWREVLLIPWRLSQCILFLKAVVLSKKIKKKIKIQEVV